MDGPDIGHVVYFIGLNQEWIKIGYSCHVRRRLRELQACTSMPYELRLLATCGYESEAEARAHERKWRDHFAPEALESSKEWLRFKKRGKGRDVPYGAVELIPAYRLVSEINRTCHVRDALRNYGLYIHRRRLDFLAFGYEHERS